MIKMYIKYHGMTGNQWVWAECGQTGGSFLPQSNTPTCVPSNKFDLTGGTEVNCKLPGSTELASVKADHMIYHDTNLEHMVFFSKSDKRLVIKWSDLSYELFENSLFCGVSCPDYAGFLPSGCRNSWTLYNLIVSYIILIKINQWHVQDSKRHPKIWFCLYLGSAVVLLSIALLSTGRELEFFKKIKCH